MSRARLLLAAIGVVLAAGCTPPVETEAFNATDVMFLQMMVPHHEQGIEIVRLAADRSDDPEIRTLAAAIEVTQADEVQMMSGWLRQWGQPAAAAEHEHEAHGGMPSTEPSEIAAVATADDFDRRLLNLLIAHQDDAIQLARFELAGGVNHAARGLAERIEKSRSAQIAQMQAILSGPSPSHGG